jgi:3-polyprenyl-4-hydroxybenzoate decarboxylase
LARDIARARTGFPRVRSRQNPAQATREAGLGEEIKRASRAIAIGTKLGIDATRKLAGEGFKRPWPPLIRMSEEVRRKVNALFGE